LEKLQIQEFHGLLLDINLVGATGLELLRQIRKHNRRTPIVMMTASANSQSAKDAMLMGAQGFLLKPFEAARLKEVIEQCFGPAV
jgi:DNA-binding NtrC family response regulator